MLLPSEMTQVSILLHKNYSDKLIAALHKKGLMQIDATSENASVETVSHPMISDIAALETRLTKLIEILKYAQPKQKGLKAVLGKTTIKKKVTSQTIEKKIIEIKSFLNDFEPDIIEIEKNTNTLIEEKEQILHLNPFLDFYLDRSLSLYSEASPDEEDEISEKSESSSIIIP